MLKKSLSGGEILAKRVVFENIPFSHSAVVYNETNVAKRWLRAGQDAKKFKLVRKTWCGNTRVIATQDFKKGDFLLSHYEKLIPSNLTKLERKLHSAKRYGCLSFTVDGKEWGLIYPKTTKSLASCVGYGHNKKVNCETCLVKSEDGALYACIFANKAINKGDHLILKHPLQRNLTCIWIGIGAAALWGIAAVVAANLILTGLGFTSAGIAGGSIAAWIMHCVAVVSGGKVAAGGPVAVLQSAGAKGLSITTNLLVGGIAAVITRPITKRALRRICGKQRNNSTSVITGAGGKLNRTCNKTK